MTVLVGSPSLAAPGLVAGAYIPPQWAGPAMVTLIVSSDGSGSGSSLVTYIFDAVLDLEHDQQVEKTRHPVQTGSDISSHAYMMPARLSMLIGMSDAMAAYSQSLGNTSPGMLNSSGAANTWSGPSKSKSVNAYQTLMTLQANRQPFTIVTRLRGYSNMILISLAPHEDYHTIAGLRARLVFEQIFTASTTTAAVSARADATDESSTGTVNPTPVPASTQAQFQQPPAQSDAANLYDALASAQNGYFSVIPGSRLYSSVPGQMGAAQ